MPSYYPLIVCRSDGIRAIRHRDGSTENNEPTKDQQKDEIKRDKEQLYKDYFRRVERDSDKDIDWRRKLGGMVMHTTSRDPKQLGKSWILQDFPEGYTLWEHVKYFVDEHGAPKKSESAHAAGGKERQDAYLYGHPQGRKKRFRSPPDFCEHLIWLCANPELDPRKCYCKLCISDRELEAAGKAMEEAAEGKVKELSTLLPNTEKRVLAAVPSPTPPPRSLEQKRDFDVNSVWIYRLGEVVWFNKGAAWGLGVIAKRRQEVNAMPRYLIQPLSNPLSHSELVIKNDEADLRPWLAWSVPDTTHNSIKHLTFDAVPWESVIRGEFGMGDHEVDGSILASKDIDISYSFFGRIASTPSVPGETNWNAMFLGAEKIWIGEPVRLRAPNDPAPDAEILVMIVNQMIEKGTVSVPSNIVNSTTVILIGDIYVFKTSTDKQIDSPAALPARMTADLRFRNEAARAASRQESYCWSLIQAGARRSISDIKGRWYESRKLLPVLRGQETFERNLSQGITSDVGTWMNSRGDSTVINGGKRKKNRRDTLGKSVPESFSISRGLDSKDSKGVSFDDNVFPEDGGDGNQQMLGLDVGDEELDMDQFMTSDPAVGFYSDAMAQ